MALRVLTAREVQIAAGLDGLDPTPWAGGQRRHLLRIRPELVSGRRIRSAAGGSGGGEASQASLPDDRDCDLAGQGGLVTGVNQLPSGRVRHLP